MIKVNESNLRDEIIKIVRVILDNESIGTEDADKELMEFGLDSLLFIRMLILLEEELHIKIPEESIFMDKMNTINKILHSLR